MEFTLADAEQALRFIDPDLARDDWAKVFMAVKSEFGADGFDLVDAWSKGGSNYDAVAVRDTWKSIKPGGGVGIGTLIHHAKQAGWAPEKREFTPEEKARYAKEQAERKARRLAAEEKERLFREQMYAVVADGARALIDELSGHEPAPSEYLDKKHVRAFGVFVAARSVLFVVNEQAMTANVITGEAAIKDFFRSGAADLDYVSVRHIRRGSVVVPMRRGKGICNVQIIFPSGKKSFPRHGRKSGCFHFMGDWSPVSEVVCIAEGYATAASVYMATQGFPCVVAFDAGNLAKVARVVRKSSPDAHIIICADNDSNTKGNPGLTAANAAANDVGGVVAVPVFKDAQ